MSARRRRQVGSILRDELSGVIQRELKDPRLGFATVLRVDVSSDMSYARVYVSVFGSQEERDATIEALQHASGFIRRQVAPRLSMRNIPRFQFILDRSMEHAEQVSRLLAEIEEEESSRDTHPAAGQEAD